MKTIKTIITILFVTLLLFFALNSLIPNKFLSILNVSSGSMEPAIKTGSIIFALKTDPSKIKAGDIINFFPTGNPDYNVTHRVQSIIVNNGNLTFSTKGDANQSSDVDTVEAQNVFGRVFLSIPFLGYFYAWTKTPLGFGLAIIIPGLLIILSEIIKIKKVVEEEAVKKYQQNQKKSDPNAPIFPLSLILITTFSILTISQSRAYFSAGLVLGNNIFSTGDWWHLLDDDDDGILNPDDRCPTTISDSPVLTLGVNRHIWYHKDDFFTTLVPAKKGEFEKEDSEFSLSYTFGCSCQQILELMPGNQLGHDKFGCSKGIVEAFIKDTDTYLPEISTTITQDNYSFQGSTQDINYFSTGASTVKLCYSFSLEPWVCDDIYSSDIIPQGSISFDFPKGDGIYYFISLGYNSLGQKENKFMPDPTTINPLDPLIYSLNKSSP